MSEIAKFSPSLRSLNPKISFLSPRASFSHPRILKIVTFPEKTDLVTERIRPVYALKQNDSLQEIDESPVSIELGLICSETSFDHVLKKAQSLGESVVIVWMAAWCRKCIYLKPKLEKLAAEFYSQRLRFYHVDVNSVPYSLVSRAGVTKMPTIQLWRDGQKQGEVIGGHKAHFVVNEVREMIENDSIT